MTTNDVIRKSKSRDLGVFSVFEKTVCVVPKTCFRAFMEGVPFLFQKASYMYKLIRNIDSSWYLLLFGTLDLLKILCLASLVKHRIARGLPRHSALMDGEVPHIVVACLSQGKTSGGQSLCTIFACLVFNAITFV